MLYNIIWKDQSKYIQVSEQEMLVKANNKDFKCFQFKDKASKIRVVTVLPGNIIIKGEW